MDTIVDDTLLLKHYLTHGWFEENGVQFSVMNKRELFIRSPLVATQPVLLIGCLITITEEGSLNFENPGCRRSWLYSNNILVPVAPDDSTEQKTYLVGSWPNVVISNNFFSSSKLPRNEASWR